MSLNGSTLHRLISDLNNTAEIIDVLKLIHEINHEGQKLSEGQQDNSQSQSLALYLKLAMAYNLAAARIKPFPETLERTLMSQLFSDVAEHWQ